jgi:hypothetical protein
MAKYFKNFPKTFYYSSYESSSVDTVTNITSRFTFEKSFKDNSVTYYEYTVQDGDTPEIIAAKFYNSPERHWIVLALNDIIDPQYDWPLDQRTIIKYIDSKYTANANTVAGQTGLEWAQSNVHSYYKIETRTDVASGIQTIDKIQLDANSYANVSITTNNYTLKDGASLKVDVTKETKSYYTYEVDTNEEKRTIKLLKPEFVGTVEEEFKRVISDTL